MNTLARSRASRACASRASRSADASLLKPNGHFERAIFMHTRVHAL